LVFKGQPISDEFVQDLKQQPMATRMPGMMHLLESRRCYVKGDYETALMHCHEAARLGPPTTEIEQLRVGILQQLSDKRR
jgi:hypothetical protein